MAETYASAEDDENVELFAEVLSRLDRQQLPHVASSLLRRLEPYAQHATKTPSVGKPMYGSYHVVFPLTFDGGGPHWVAKFPINGIPSKWDSLSAASLDSEANTMRLLKRETIPVPSVVDFSSTTENPLRCPYIIMTFISGTSLYDIWFGHRLSGVSPPDTHAKRTRVLQDIAAAMIQLDKFSFTTSGRLLFDSNGAMLDRWFIHKDPDDTPIYVEIPPVADPKAYYTFFLNHHQPEPTTNPITKGTARLLRQLITWIPSTPNDTHPFVLAYPDFDVQNFLVSADTGELLGIIDWDGVSAVPRTVGNERYPGWLTRDWDPAMYGYEESMDAGVEPDGVWEDSPACLARWREVYEGTMTGYVAERRGGGESRVGFCRMSLITENLAIAACDVRCRDAILRKIVGEIWVVGGYTPALDFMALVERFAEGDVGGGTLEMLKKGFGILLSKEGL